MPRIEFPKCISCGTDEDVWPCQVCGKSSCWECTIIQRIDDELECLHLVAPDKESNIEWKLPTG